MGIFRALDISASGLTAQSFRMDIIAQNVANAETTRTATGEPYQRRQTVLATQTPSFAETVGRLREADQAQAAGVVVSESRPDETPFRLVYDPSHADADESGYVRLPNVDIAREYVDMIAATRAYEANVTVMNASKRMAVKALEMGK